ncbi:MAG: hypothetical protein H6673_05625 [Anaerolineales bacterium]|nr:hypothetical protein [Anaerolineales bacterium]
MSDLTPPPNRITVDAEHIGIRTILPILAFLGFAGGILLGRIIASLIDEALSPTCISASLALVGAIGMVQLSDKLLKRVWTSGRYLDLDAQCLTLVDERRKTPEQQAISWQQPFQVQAWYFEVPTRKSRVPKGWYCASVRFNQGQYDYIVYTFLKPDEAIQQIASFHEWFVTLKPKKEREELSSADPRWAAQQERYRRLENQRWQNGAEISAESFYHIFQFVQRYGQINH